MQLVEHTAETLVVTVRGLHVMLAADLAAVYGVETRVLNQQVRRNPDRFPADFAFQLTAKEFARLLAGGVVTADGRACLRSRSVIIKRGGHAKYLPYVFTEHGAIMAASVLNSPRAVAMGVFVVRAFVRMREQLVASDTILRRLAEIDKTLVEHDGALRVIWDKLQPLLLPPPPPPRRKIGYAVEEARARYRVRQKRT